MSNFPTAVDAPGWSNPDAVEADDGAFASTLIGHGDAATLAASGFGFSTGPVSGVTFNVNLARGLGLCDARLTSARLMLAGVASGENRADGASLPHDFATVSLGGSADTWGLPLTAADVADPGFGLELIFSSAGSVGGVAVKVQFVCGEVH